MTDEQFRQLCNTYGFAPSRALRELIDCATAGAEAAEREACAQIARNELSNCNMLLSYPAQSSAAWNIMNAIRTRKEKP